MSGYLPITVSDVLMNLISNREIETFIILVENL